jgi:hypothetical protein
MAGLSQRAGEGWTADRLVADNSGTTKTNLLAEQAPRFI